MSVLLAPDMKPPPEQGDRSTGFLARIDAVLETIWPKSAQIAFLDKQIKAWEGAYAEFRRTDGASEPNSRPGDPPQASDFTLTITGLEARRCRLADAPVRGLCDMLNKAGQ